MTQPAWFEHHPTPSETARTPVGAIGGDAASAEAATAPSGAALAADGVCALAGDGDARTIDARAIDARAIDARTIDARAIDARAIDARASDAVGPAFSSRSQGARPEQRLEERRDARQGGRWLAASFAPAPPGWRRRPTALGALYDTGGLCAMVSDEREGGRRFVVLSLSRADRMPTEADAAFAVASFVGSPSSAPELMPQAKTIVGRRVLLVRCPL